MKIQILLVETGKLNASATWQKLQEEPNIEVSAVAEGINAVEYIRKHPVQLVLLDLADSTSNIVAILKAIRQSEPRLPVLVLSSRCDEETIVQCLAYGANGYFVKERYLTHLPRTIRDILKGQHVYPDKVAMLLSQYLLRQLSRTNGELNLPVPLEKQLSAREKQIAGLLAKRLSNREIAEALSLSEGTVKNHLTAIFGKIEVKNRREAIRILCQSNPASPYPTAK